MGASWPAGTRAAEGQSVQQVRCGQGPHLHHCNLPCPVLWLHADPTGVTHPHVLLHAPCFRFLADMHGMRYYSQRGQPQEGWARLRPLHPHHRSRWWEPDACHPEPPCQPSSREWRLHPSPPPPKGTNLSSSTWHKHLQPLQSSDTTGRHCSAGHARIPARQPRASTSCSRDKTDPDDRLLLTLRKRIGCVNLSSVQNPREKIIKNKSMTAEETRAEPEGKGQGSKHQGKKSDAVGAAEPAAKSATSSTGTQSDWCFHFEPGFLMGSEAHLLTQSSTSMASPRGAQDILRKLYQGPFDTKVPLPPLANYYFYKIKAKHASLQLKLKGSSSAMQRFATEERSEEREKQQEEMPLTSPHLYLGGDIPAYIPLRPWSASPKFPLLLLLVASPWPLVQESSCSHIHATQALGHGVQIPKINMTHCICVQN